MKRQKKDIAALNRNMDEIYAECQGDFQKAAVELYNAIDPFLRHVAGRFAKCYGWNGDDTYSDACWFFFEALREYDPKRGSLAGHIKFRVIVEFKDKLQVYTRRKRLTGNHRVDPNGIGRLKAYDHNDTSVYDHLLLELSNDAGLLIEVIRSNILQYKNHNTARIMLRRYFLEEFGWVPERYSRAFEEVSEAVKELGAYSRELLALSDLGIRRNLKKKED